MAANRRPSWQHVWRAAATIGERGGQSALNQPSLYVVATAALIVGAVFVHTALDFAQRNAVLAVAQPLFPAVSAAVTLLSIYLALNASVSAARERDLGTLEVLLYGPVNLTAFVLGKFWSALRVYLVMLALLFIWVNIVTFAFNLAFSPPLVVLLALSIPAAAAVIAFGLLVAALGGKTRSTLIVFIVVVAALVAVQVADAVVTDIIPIPENATQNDPLLVVRAALAALTAVVGWLSPYAQLQNAFLALTTGLSGQFALHLGVLIVQLVVMMGGAILLFNRRGTR